MNRRDLLQGALVAPVAFGVSFQPAREPLVLHSAVHFTEMGLNDVIAEPHLRVLEATAVRAATSTYGFICPRLTLVSAVEKVRLVTDFGYGVRAFYLVTETAWTPPAATAGHR